MKARKSKSIRPHQSRLIYAALATLAGFLIPVVQQALLPLQYLNTHLHEFSHAIVAILTRGEVEKIVVNANGSGFTPVSGGNLVLVASAGYVGASCFGAAMIVLGRTEKGARWALGALTALLTLSMVIWVRGDMIGEVSGAAWISMLAAMTLIAKNRSLQFVVQFLGLQQCLNSFGSLFTLVKLSVATEVHSDASLLQGYTGVSAVVWSIGWSCLSLVLVLFALRKSWTPSTDRA